MATAWEAWDRMPGDRVLAGRLVDAIAILGIERGIPGSTVLRRQLTQERSAGRTIRQALEQRP